MCVLKGGTQRNKEDMSSVEKWGGTARYLGPPGQSWKRTARGVVPRRRGPLAATTSMRTCVIHRSSGSISGQELACQ